MTASDTAADVQRSLQRIAAENLGRWAFSVRERGTLTASVNGGTQVPAASTIKVALAVLVLQCVEGGRTGLTDSLIVPSSRAGGAGLLKNQPERTIVTVREAIDLMITVSDNTATNMLIDLLGLGKVNAGIRGLGLSRSEVNRHMMDAAARQSGRENVTCADDQSQLMDLLDRGELLPSRQRDFLVELLGRQTFTDRLPSRLGPDVRCFHKTGELDGIRHDVGLLRFDDRSISIAALGWDLGGGDAAAAALAARVIGSAAEVTVNAARSGAAQHPSSTVDNAHTAERLQ